MNKIAAAMAAVMNYLKTYPALAAALANLGVFAAGYLGLHITAGQLVMYVGVANVLLGALVHSNVTPIVKLKPVTLSIGRGGGGGAYGVTPVTSSVPASATPPVPGTEVR